MRVSWQMNLIAGALTALFLVSGCGNDNNTNITIGEGSPTPGAHTPTPGRTATTAAKTATPAAAATPTATAGAATATATTAGGPTPTATSSPGGGGLDAGVQSMASGLLPFLTSTSLVTGGSVSSLTAGAAFGERVRLVEAVKTDPCPDGGTRVDDQGVPTRTITLTACKVSQASLGHFQFDGTVVLTLTSLTGGTIGFQVTSIDIDHNNHQVQFSGTLTLSVDLSGNFILNGPLTIMTPEGNFVLQTNQITINSDRHLVSGSGSISDTSNNFDFATVAMTVVQGGATANFSVTFDDQSVHTYSLDLTTGALTQTS
jgi:hypothetical protein